MSIVQRTDLAAITEVAPARAIVSATRAVHGSIRSSVTAPSRPVALWAIICSTAAPILFVTAWLIAGLLQPPSYSPMRNTISGLSGQAASDRWIVTAALAIVGGSYVITAAGLHGVRLAARIDLLIAGGAGIGVAACPQPADGTTTVHLVFATIGAAAIAIWPALTARGRNCESAVIALPIALTVTAVFVAMLGWLFIEARTGGAWLGMVERLDASLQICWPPVLAIALYRADRQRQREPEPLEMPR
ncbi:MAG TPA: DUF998 domain-containing protein [Micromonosporaceae bacterium]